MLFRHDRIAMPQQERVGPEPVVRTAIDERGAPRLHRTHGHVPGAGKTVEHRAAKQCKETNRMQPTPSLGNAKAGAAGAVAVAADIQKLQQIIFLSLLF